MLDNISNNINIDEAEACKGTHNYDKQTHQCLFILTNCCFIMFSACNTVVLFKSFEMTIYTPKTEVG